MAKTFYNESELIFAERAKHGRFKDLTGQKFNRLTVLGFAGILNRQWFCKCECGNVTKVQSGSLKNGNTTSCGCLHKERVKEVRTKHGHSAHSQESRTYNTWKTMLKRCQNPNYKDFNNYGGRGIIVCERWQSFENFLADMGERPEGKTLDRKENDKGYYPENCKWADWFEQANNRRNNHFLTHNGKTQTLAQWTKELGFKRTTIITRLRHGWSIERTLTTLT